MKKGGLVLGILAFPLVLLLLVIPIMGGSDAAAATCSSTGGAPLQVSGSVAAWGRYSTEQMTNAATVVEVGAEKNIPPRGQQIALMTALDESGLQNLSGGDRDSVGLFQQRPSMGWGTVQQLLNPAYTAGKFYDRLVTITGWETMTPPTNVAHAVQGNAVPGVYQQFWDPAGTILTHLASATSTSSADPSTSASSASAAGTSGAGSTPYCDSSTSDNGGGGFQVNGAVAYVGAYTPAVLHSRAQGLAADGGGWYRACEASVEVLAGRRGTNFSSAASAMASFQAAGVFHSANSIDGHAPPIGAWLYYSSAGNPFGHVATYLGNGQVAGTDTWRVGHVDIGPASDITNGRWRLTYQGWAVPWGTPATDVPVVAPNTSASTAPAATAAQGGS